MKSKKKIYILAACGLLFVLGMALLPALHRGENEEADVNKSVCESERTSEAAETISEQAGTEDIPVQSEAAETISEQPETTEVPAVGQEETAASDVDELPMMTDKESSGNKNNDGDKQQTSGQQTSAGNSAKPTESSSASVPDQETGESSEKAVEETLEKDSYELPIIPVR